MLVSTFLTASVSQAFPHLSVIGKAQIGNSISFDIVDDGETIDIPDGFTIQIRPIGNNRFPNINLSSSDSLTLEDVHQGQIVISTLTRIPGRVGARGPNGEFSLGNRITVIGETGPPGLIRPLPDLEITNQQTTTVDLSNHFASPANLPLTYVLSGSPADVDTVLDGSNLRITPRKPGQYSMTVGARDSQDRSASANISFTVPGVSISSLSISGLENGQASEGATLQAVISPSNATILEYRWQHSNSRGFGFRTINGATSSTLQLPADLRRRGEYVSVFIGYIDSNGNVRSRRSEVITIARVNVAPAGSLTLSKTNNLAVGDSISADASGISDNDGLPAQGSFRYQWHRSFC